VRVEHVAGRERDVLDAGAALALDEKFFVNVEPKPMNLISTKIAKHLD